MIVAVKIIILIVLIAACLSFCVPVLWFESKAIRALYQHHQQTRHEPHEAPVVPWNSSLKISGAMLGVFTAIGGGRHYRAVVNVARNIVGDDFRISFPEREMLAYWEGEDGYLFHGGWGVTPPVVAVPSAEAWPEVTPPWLHASAT